MAHSSAWLCWIFINLSSFSCTVTSRRGRPGRSVVFTPDVKRLVGSTFPVKFEHEKKTRRQKRWQEVKKHSFASSNLRDKSSLSLDIPGRRCATNSGHTCSCTAKDKDPHSFIMRPLAGLNRPLCDCPTCCCHPQNYLIWVDSIFNWTIYQLSTILFIVPVN